MGVFEIGIKQRIADSLVPNSWYSFEYLKEATMYKRSIVNSRGRDRFIEHLSEYAIVEHYKSKRGRSVLYKGIKESEAEPTPPPPPPRIQYKKCVRVVIEEWQSKHRTRKTHKDIGYSDLYGMYFSLSLRKYTPKLITYERIRSCKKYSWTKKVNPYTDVYERIQAEDFEGFNRLITRAAFNQVAKDIYEIARTSNKVEKKHLLKDIEHNKTKAADKREVERIEYVFMKYGKGKTVMLNGNRYKQATAEIEALCPGYAYRGVLYDIKFTTPFPNREMYTEPVVHKKLFDQWKKTIERFISSINDNETRLIYEAIYDLWLTHVSELQKQMVKK